MTDLTPGVHEFKPAELAKLIRQYDHFMITSGNESFLQIRIPAKWVKLERNSEGVNYFTCRNKRKRDGHLFEIHGNKFFFDVGYNADRLSGQLKTDLSDTNYFISLWKKEDDAAIEVDEQM